MRAELADGRVLEFPDGTAPEVVQATVKKVLGIAPDRVSKIPNNIVPPIESTAIKPLIIGDILGVGEALASGASGLLGGIAGQFAGVGRTLTGGKFGTQEGIRQGEDTARNVAEAMTYRPRTETGQSIMETVGDVVDITKIAGIPPSQALTFASRVQQPAPRPTIKLPDFQRKEQAPMVGLGSAMTDKARIRAERAQALPVPLPLTKGMLSRDFEQQRFERETAKAGSIGEPLRERHADLNQKILQNFDAFVEQTGSEAGGLRAVGQIVNDAIVNKSKMAKSHIDAAYKKARESGAMSEPVNVNQIQQYIESHRPEAINAPIISSLEAKLNSVLKKNPFGNPTATINDLEEVRKMVGTLSGKDATNAHFGKEIKTLIDGLTENAGGADYKRARALRLKYGKEFEDVGVIDKMMRTKPGTRDRAVAYEDVFKHSILSGSLDDVRAVRKTLQTAGPEGMQAWRELQGQTVQHIKDEITKNVSTDIRGNKVVSAAQLDRIIRELDKDDKLDFIF